MAQKLTLQSAVKLNSGYTLPLLGFGVSPSFDLEALDLSNMVLTSVV